MRASDIFDSKSLKADDIKGREPVVTIKAVTVKEFPDKTRKPYIEFEGAKKGLVCNVTNWNAIRDITGEDDSDNWIGQRIKLVVARVDFQGRRVDAIRVDAPGRSREPERPPSKPLSAERDYDPEGTGEDDNFHVDTDSDVGF